MSWRICDLCGGDEVVCGGCDLPEDDCKCPEFTVRKCPECKGMGGHEADGEDLS